MSVGIWNLMKAEKSQELDCQMAQLETWDSQGVGPWQWGQVNAKISGQ